MSRYEYHESVLLSETIDALNVQPDRLYVDGTLGGGGHSAAMLELGARVIGLDQDSDAIAYASAKLESYGTRFTAVRSSFVDVDAVLSRLGVAQVDGVLLDLGISSHQIDVPERGFSFQQDGPLDMRMDTSGGLTAADLVNEEAPERLEEIFRTYGEEPQARRIVGQIVRDRMQKPFTSTLQLAASIERISPRRGRAHPATRVFQALRIAVNRELEILPLALERFAQRLAPHGRFAVITFHSLEDRLVKQFFKKHATEWIDRPEWPAARPNPDRLFSLVHRKAVVASEQEQKANPRSRSAKLRVVEKLSVTTES